MSEKNKPQGENKPQQPVAPKPTPTQSTTDFATRRVFVEILPTQSLNI